MDAQEIDETLETLTLDKVEPCRRFIRLSLQSGTMTEPEADAWRWRLDAWEAFLLLDVESVGH